MHRRIKTFLLFSVFLFSVTFVFAQTPAAKMPAAGMPQKQAKAAQTKDLVQTRLKELTKQLDLSPEQQQKIRDILSNSNEQARGILEAARQKVLQIRIKAHDDILLLLSPSQKKKFQGTRRQHETAPKIAE